MEPTSVLFGVLLASTKGLAFAAIGFGIAWWRGRRRIRELEQSPDDLRERLDRVESTLDYVATTMDRLGSGQEELRRGLLPRSAQSPPETPAGREEIITPH
ncbi:MAG: hypothetical protein ABJD11_00810 [Gemmatimonadota bacterium]